MTVSTRFSFTAFMNGRSRLGSVQRETITGLPEVFTSCWKRISFGMEKTSRTASEGVNVGKVADDGNPFCLPGLNLNLNLNLNRNPEKITITIKITIKIKRRGLTHFTVQKQNEAPQFLASHVNLPDSDCFLCWQSFCSRNQTYYGQYDVWDPRTGLSSPPPRSRSGRRPVAARGEHDAAVSAEPAGVRLRVVERAARRNDVQLSGHDRFGSRRNQPSVRCGKTGAHRRHH